MADSGNGSFLGPVIALGPEGVEIPPGIVNLERFRQWCRSDAFPEHGRIDWVSGRLEVDMSPEDLHTHGTPKSTIGGKLVQLIQEAEKGFVFIDRGRLSCPGADVSAEPDVLVLLLGTLESGEARLIPTVDGLADRYIEIEGLADLVVECVSKWSVKKDTKRLKEAYFKAGVREYWLADARGAAVQFDVLVRGASGFEPAAKDADGFAPSSILGQSVRLTRKRRAAGLTFYTLEVR